MGRKPCCEKVGLKRGPWAAEEDKKLVSFINTHGISCWRAVPKLAGLLRCGKSCRLRWTNYLRPDLKRGILTEAEENLIFELHATLGNRWSRIAVQLPGRTDNEIKNFWNTRLKKRLRSMGLDPDTHKPTESSDGSSSTDMETVVSNLEEHSSATTPAEHGSNISQVQPLAPASIHLSEEAPSAQVKTFGGEPAARGLNALMNNNMDQPSKSKPAITNAKQDPQSSNSEPTNHTISKQGLQCTNSTDLLSSNTKHEEPSGRSHLENFHMVPSLGPKVEDAFMNDLQHPHDARRHLRLQEENNVIWLNSPHELGGGGNITPSSGVFQDLDVGSNLLRQSSGTFGFSDMGVGNWFSLGEVIQGQSPISSWSDFHGAGRPLQEPELQKLAAFLDQI